MTTSFKNVLNCKQSWIARLEASIQAAWGCTLLRDKIGEDSV